LYLATWSVRSLINSRLLLRSVFVTLEQQVHKLFVALSIEIPIFIDILETPISEI
jgi:hypothetical protein